MHRYIRNMILAGALSSMIPAAALDLPVKSINGHKYFYYEVRAGDTVFSLSRSLGISRDDIIRHNPSAADGLRTGSFLYFPYEDFSDNGAKYINHEVKRGETLFGLAHRYGTTPDDIVASNPATVNGLKSGTIIRIPVTSEIEESDSRHAAAPNETPLYIPEPAPVVAEQPENDIKTEADTLEQEITEPVIAEESEISETTDSIEFIREANIAVVFPFALSEEKTSKQAQLFIDFYRGMLLAADSLSASGQTVTIKAYDSTNMQEDDFLLNASVILAPEDATRMAALSKSIADSDAFVLNMFSLKDETYLTDPSIIQGNIPHTQMYAKAYQGMRERFGDIQPVILHNNTGRNEKSAFTEYIRSRYIADGIAPEELAYNGTLLSSDLDRLDANAKYVIVPSSGTLAEFNRMSHAIKAYRDDTSTASIEIFGYPDWIAFRNDARDMLHSINATVYTRVFFDTESKDAMALNEKFKNNFGTPSMEVVPNQGALGRDVATMLIDNLRANGGVFTPEDSSLFQGIQSVFKFEKASDEGGFVNNALLIVQFLPDRTTNTEVL